jgi:hypothetical protein
MDKGKYLRQSLDRLKLFPVIAFDSSYECKINETPEVNGTDSFIVRCITQGIRPLATGPRKWTRLTVPPPTDPACSRVFRVSTQI